MAMSYSFRVLENGSRDMILQVNSVDTAATTGGTADGTSNGILVANSLPVSLSTKVRRILYNLMNNTVRIQWHATSNTDIAIVGPGYGDFSLDYARSGTQGIINDKAAGATGDIDLANFCSLSTGIGLGGAMSLVLFMVKGT